MVGLGYRMNRQRLAAELSLAGGVAFNGVRAPMSSAASCPLRAHRSLVWRPGVTVWYDLSRHLALNAFLGYVVTRPSVAYLENGQIDTRRLHADTLLLTAGVAYKLF